MKPNTKALLKLTLGACLAFILPLFGIVFGAEFLGGNIDAGILVGTVVSIIIYLIIIYPYLKNKNIQRTLLALSFAAVICVLLNLLIDRMPFGFSVAFGFWIIAMGVTIPIATMLKNPDISSPSITINGDSTSFVFDEAVDKKDNIGLIFDEEAAKKKAKKARIANISVFVVFGCLAVVVLVLNVLPKSGSTPEDIGNIYDNNNPTCTAKNITFPIQADWVPVPDKEGLFMNKDSSKMLGLNNVTPLGGGDPKEILKGFIAQYEEQYTIHNNPIIANLTTYDGVLCYTTEIQLSVNDTTDGYAIAIAVPQKNLLISFTEHWPSSIPNPSDTIINSMFGMTFEVGNDDFVSGNTFVSQGDGSELCLKDDGSFYYYAAENVHNERYYIGRYECFYGQEAFDKVASMSDYGITTEALEQLLSSNMNGYIPGGSTSADSLYLLDSSSTDNLERYSICKDSFYALILTNDKVVMSKDNIQDSGNTALYVGYYIPELKLLDLTNLNAIHQYGFKLKGSTSTLDIEPTK